MGFHYSNGSNYGLLEDPNNPDPAKRRPASYNWTGIQQYDCNPTSSLTKVALFNHIDYGGECVSVSNPDLGYDVPFGSHISSIYLNPIWLILNPQYFHTLTLWMDITKPGVQKSFQIQHLS